MRFRSRRRERDARDIANRELERLLRRPDPPVRPFVDLSDEFDRRHPLPHDRRLFHFHEPEVFTLVDDAPLETVVSPAMISRGAAVVHPVSPARYVGVRSLPVSQPRVAQASSVAVCVRRHRRREVLFAYRRTGRNSAIRRRNRWSDVRC